jgi:hypothetical protein
MRSFILVLLCASLILGCGGPQFGPHQNIPKNSSQPITEKKKSIIIYPQSFKEAAYQFEYLHREFGGTEALLVSLEEIAASSLPIEQIRIPHDGWENMRPKHITIRNYDFKLAKKIIAFLKDLEKKHDILAVLLLGDGGVVAPSYYFYIPYLNTLKTENKPYNEWIASDLMYGSPDLDFKHEWAVGRISVDNVDQAMRVAEKYYKWLRSNQAEPPASFIYFAGNIRKDVVYSGELLYLMLEGEGIIGTNSVHYLESHNRYTISHLKNSFKSDSGYLHYIFSHGSGDGFEIDGQHLYSNELMSMPYKSGLPLVVSSSCLDGGFDYDLIDAPHDYDGISIGEAILRSPGAGIGYLGSSRISLGQFHYLMRDGEISPHSMYYRYMPGLLFEFLQSYHNGSHRLADAYVEAHERYLEKFGIEDPRDFATFVELNLLADPVVILPEPSRTVASLPHLEIISEHKKNRRAIIVPSKQVVRYKISDDSPYDSIETTIINAKTGHILLKKQVTRSKELAFVTRQTGSYILRLDQPDGLINYQFFQSRDF